MRLATQSLSNGDRRSEGDSPGYRTNAARASGTTRSVPVVNGPHPAAPPRTSPQMVKYLALGWWQTSAEVDCSGQS